MKSSQQYPRAFGHAVADHHVGFMQSDPRNTYMLSFCLNLWCKIHIPIIHVINIGVIIMVNNGQC